MTANGYLKRIIAKYSLSETEEKMADEITGSIRDVLRMAYGERVDSAFLCQCSRTVVYGESFEINMVIHFQKASFTSR